MNVQQKLHDALVAITAIGARVYPGGRLPDGPTYPCALYQFTGNAASAGYAYLSRKTDFHPQITIFARDYPAIRDLRLAVLNAVEAMPECAAREMDFEAGFDFQLQVFIWHLQFQLTDFET